MSTLALRSRAAISPAMAGPFLRGPRAAWAALFLNVMAFLGTGLVVLVPQSMGQAVAQAMLLVSLGLALLANPGMVVRPNIFLTLLSALAVFALIVDIHSEFPYGSTYRAVRLILFVGVLWLLTPWWGRPDAPLLRAHLACLRVILGTVWLGALIAPGSAFGTEARLSGVLWPIPPPQVAHYAAILLGCTVVLWSCGVIGGRSTAITVFAAVATMVATHTRTALLGTVLGLVVAGASLFMGYARVRRAVTVVLLGSVAAWTVFSPVIVSWLARGQSAQDLTQLTGRTKVWAAIAQQKFTTVQELFGVGLGNKSFDGLPIDSNWVATRYELGRFGVAIDVAFLLVLVLVALTRPPGPRRAIALFLVAYCVTASFTETGLGDASPYLLDLTVAASLLASAPGTPLRRLVRTSPTPAEVGMNAQIYRAAEARTTPPDRTSNRGN